MNPFQKNKIDVSSLSEEEQKLFRLYGKLPNKKDILQNKLKERKYFDSGDYAMSKAGKTPENGVATVGSQHPLPENIPHLAPNGPNGTANGNGHSNHGSMSSGMSGSPVKEASFLQRETSVDEQAVESPEKETPNEEPQSPQKEGVPIRWQSS